MQMISYSDYMMTRAMMSLQYEYTGHAGWFSVM